MRPVYAGNDIVVQCIRGICDDALIDVLLTFTYLHVYRGCQR